ncbi:hypothetical protein BDZ97DRAFT_1912450 [Flammula alnicola]|nr:hypothetical protein BDZ97DRAFT_1912450 [Flammula alnicola]
MQRTSLPPPHPSLPPHPSTSRPNQPSQYTQPNAPFPTYYNSHYIQAYAQPLPQAPAANYYSSHSIGFNGTSQKSSNSRGEGANVFRPSMSTWYQPGSSRCTHPGCTFTGSHKSVEVHMMDRHLIYPPGWEKRKKKPDWDADPSLKGKPIPIQGTNVILDSPEVLEAWIAERKRRFPTSSRVEDKKRKLEEAVARGQLDLTGASSTKRRKVEHQDNLKVQNGRQFSGDRGRHGPRNNLELARVPDSGWGARSKGKELAAEVVKMVVSPPPSHSECGSDGDGEPEAFSSKIAPTIKPPAALETKETTVEQDTAPAFTGAHAKHAGNRKKTQPQQPKLPPRNPFASRPTLLRNLLLPEIRITVSNLSQAIRFLVDNDFLRDVELKPGQAVERNKIQVMEQDGDGKDKLVELASIS